MVKVMRWNFNGMVVVDVSMGDYRNGAGRRIVCDDWDGGVGILILGSGRIPWKKRNWSCSVAISCKRRQNNKVIFFLITSSVEVSRVAGGD